MAKAPSHKPFRIALVGASYMGQYHLQNWTRMDDVEVVGICDTNTERADALVKQQAGSSDKLPIFCSVERMMEALQPDIVDITTPSNLHLDIMQAIAPSGADVICDMPCGGGLEDAREAVRLSKEHGFRLALYAAVRFQPWYSVSRRYVEDGALGEPYEIQFRLRPGDGRGPRAYVDRMPHFQIVDRNMAQQTAIHWIDMFSTVMGDVTGVFARLSRLNPAIAGEDAGVIYLDFASGARGVFDGNRLSDHGAVNCRLTMGEMILEGSSGTLRLDGSGRLWMRQFGNIEEREQRFPWRNNLIGGDSLYLCARHILDAWRAGKEPDVSARKLLRAQAAIEAVYESAKTGAYVSLPNKI